MFTNRTKMFSEQDTMPLPRIRDTRPTFRQGREYYGLSREDIVQQARVHVAFVKRLETGFRVELFLVVMIINALAKKIGCEVHIAHLKGICIKKHRTFSTPLAWRKS